jgi:hypothetical protein
MTAEKGILARVVVLRVVLLENNLSASQYKQSRISLSPRVRKIKMKSGD